MGRPAPGQLERSLAAMTIAPHQELAKRRKALLDTKTGHKMQFTHTPLDGVALPDWEYIDKEVQWEMPFLYGPLQHQVPFKTPHFASANFEITSGTDAFIDFRAQVVGWDVADEGWYTGATIRFTLYAPTVSSPLDYTAIAHCGFVGWATMSETGEFG